MPEIVLKRAGKISHRYYFDRDSLTMGRGPENDIVLDSVSVSRAHAQIRKVEGRYILSDLQSANGTLLNSSRITRTEIVDQDTIKLGEFELQFLREQSAGAQGELKMVRPLALRFVKGRQAGETFPITKAETMVGRGADCDLRLSDWFASKHHALITRRGAAYTIVDLESLVGTTVNGERLRGAHNLQPGEVLTIGRTVFEVRLAGVRDSTTDTAYQMGAGV